MSREQNEIGKAGELRALQVLAGRGVRMAEKIGSPVRLVPSKIPQAYFVYWGEKVSGDVNGILDSGIRVLAEVKTVMDGNPTWSKLRAHQPGRLDINKEFGGVSLLVWVHNSGIYVLDWVYPNDDFRPGRGLKPPRAAALDVMDVNQLVREK